MCGNRSYHFYKVSHDTPLLVYHKWLLNIVHFPQNIHTNEQYLKFDNMYASGKTFTLFECKKTLNSKKSF